MNNHKAIKVMCAKHNEQRKHVYNDAILCGQNGMSPKPRTLNWFNIFNLISKSFNKQRSVKKFPRPS